MSSLRELARYWPCDTGQALDEMAALLGKLTSMTKQRDTLAAALMQASTALEYVAFQRRYLDRRVTRLQEYREAHAAAIALARSIVEPGAQ